MSEIADVADAVAAAINAAVASSGLSEDVTAIRVYVPVFVLRDLEDIGVRVVPKGYDRTNDSRNSVRREIPIDIGVAKRVPQDCNPETADGNTELDAFMTLVEEIAALFEKGELADTEARWLRTEVADPIYDVEKLRTDRQAISVITVRFVINN